MCAAQDFCLHQHQVVREWKMWVSAFFTPVRDKEQLLL